MMKLLFLIIAGGIGLVLLRAWSPKATTKAHQPELPLGYLANRVPAKKSGDDDDSSGGGSARAPDKLKDEKFRERRMRGGR